MVILCHVASPAELVYPVATLREQVTLLEAAITLAIADVAKKPVHHLRTTTRRIEAHLALLEYLGQTPAKGRALKHARKVLRRVRRAAGRVRDLDVHADLLERYATRAPEPDAGSAEHDVARTKRLQDDAHSLRETIERRRTRRAAKLQKMLERRRTELAPALEAMLESLDSEQDLALSPSRLAESTREWFRQQERSHRIPERSDDDLHATRKAAKMARYLAESSAETAELARDFEAVQESGGTWHDLLALAETAGQELGRKRPLRLRLRRDAREARDAYRTHLKTFREQRGGARRERVKRVPNRSRTGSRR